MHHWYWNHADYVELERARSFHELNSIAVRILKRMERPVAQVCGPISTGGVRSVERNLVSFDLAIATLIGKGVTVFNQIPFEMPMQRIRAKQALKIYNMELLLDFYLPLFEQRHIEILYFLPDWQTSVGARWEHKQAERLNMKIIYLS